MSEAARSFEIGQGRSRPEHKPRPIKCEQCGAALEVPDERAQTLVCQYCNTQLALTPTEARILSVAQNPVDFELPVGAKVVWKGVHYVVAGRVASAFEGDDPDDPLTHDFLLYNPRAPSLWLSSYGGEWSTSHRTRVMPDGDPFERAPGEILKTHDGREWKLVEQGQTVIRYVDGALPWRAQVGDESRYAELSGKGTDASKQTYEVERSARGELELNEGQSVPLAAVKAACGGQLKVSESAAPAEAKRPVLRPISLGMMGFGLLALFTSVHFACSSKPVARATLTGEIGKVGPITVTRPHAVYEVSVDQSFRRNGWTYLEGEVDDAQGDYLYSFGGDLWSESGHDSDGYWHEEDNDFDIDLSIPQPGTYYLAFKGENSASKSTVHAGFGPTGPSSDPGNNAVVTVSTKAGSGIPFCLLGLFELIVGFILYLVSSPKAREALVEFAEEMAED